MVEKFSEIASEDAPGEWSAIRASQCWQILISKASASSVLTYQELAELMGIHRRSLNRILGYIMFYCEQNLLPPLTSIVVRQDTGLPGEGFTAEQAASVPASHILVFRYDWFDIRPPTIDEFIQAFRVGST